MRARSCARTLTAIKSFQARACSPARTTERPAQSIAVPVWRVRTYPVHEIIEDKQLKPHVGCDPLPSILDLMSPSCGMRAAPTARAAGDLDFLKAMYWPCDGRVQGP